MECTPNYVFSNSLFQCVYSNKYCLLQPFVGLLTIIGNVSYNHFSFILK